MVMLIASSSYAQLSTGSTIHYFTNFSDSDLPDPDVPSIINIHPSPMDEFGYDSFNKFGPPKLNYFRKEKQPYNANSTNRQFDDGFGSDFTFSIRTPSSGAFDLKNNRDDITEYRSCLSKAINYADQSKCNIEILLGKKFNL
jgi:hypothetical protein